jgi:hypothetical protein
MLRDGTCVSISYNTKVCFVLRSSFVSCRYHLFKYDCNSDIIILIPHHNIRIRATLIPAHYLVARVTEQAVSSSIVNWGVSSSNLGQHIKPSDGNFLWFYSLPRVKYQGQCLKIG